MRLSLASVFMTVLVACAPPVVDTTEDERILRGKLTAWWAAATAQDLEVLVDHYADDAVLMAANWPTATGKDAIRAFFLALWETGSARVAGDVAEIHISGDLAMLRGSATVRVTPSDGSEPFDDSNSFVEVYRRQPDGSWKSIWDIWNSTLPLP